MPFSRGPRDEELDLARERLHERAKCTGMLDRPARGDVDDHGRDLTVGEWTEDVTPFLQPLGQRARPDGHGVPLAGDTADLETLLGIDGEREPLERWRRRIED